MIIRNLSNEDYNNLEGLRSTDIKNMAKGPEYYKLKTGTYDQTPAMLLGSMVHERILEPSVFEKKYEAKLDGRTKDGKDQKKREDEGKIITVKSEDLQKVERMRDAFFTNQSCKEIYKASEAEVTAQYKEFAGDKTGKAKADLLGETFIADIKTSSRLPLTFKKAEWLIYDFEYHMSAAYYMDLFRQAGMTSIDRFIWIFIDTSDPHKIVLCEAPYHSSIIENGRKRYTDLIRKIDFHEQLNFWKETLKFTLD